MNDAHLCTDLHKAAKVRHSHCIKELIKRGANVNILNTRGWTPLIWTTSDEECTRILLQNGADPNYVNIEKRGWTPFHWAVSEGCNIECIQLLLDYGAKSDIKNTRGNTPFDLAQDETKEFIITYLLRESETPIKEPDCN